MALQDISNPIVFLGGYVKRFTATLGLNSTPSTVDLEVIPGSNSVSYDVSHNATGFDFNGAEPGKMSGFAFGAFNFVGIIQSWTEDYGTQGLSYNIKLADPRILFDGVQLAVGPGVVCPSFNYPNLLNVFGYYGTPSGAGVTPEGSLFYRIRDYLTTTGVVNAYGKRLSFNFDQGFASSTGSMTVSGITNWYQIKSRELSLSQLLDQVSQDHGFDYYAAIRVSGYNPSTSTVSPVDIKSIKRINAKDSTQLSGYIVNWTASGILSSYRRGRELRRGGGGGDGSSANIITGPESTAWFGCNTGDIFPYWGTDNDGAAIFNTSVPQSGLIKLDIPGSTVINSVLSDSAFRISYTKYNTIVTSNTTYPPVLTTSNTIATVTGYYATEYTLRAALVSQDAWESILYTYQPTIATKLGIIYPPFLDKGQKVNAPQDIYFASLGTIVASGREDLPAEYIVLIKSVYEATRNAASEFYGKQFICQTNNNGYDAFQSTWLNGGGYGIDIGYPSIEYEPVQSAWSQKINSGVPSGVSNHDTLHDTDNPTFKDERNQLKAFFSFRHYNNDSNSNFPYAIDLRKMSRSEYFIEQGNKLCVPVSAEQYEKYPLFTKFTIGPEVYGLTGGAYAASGYGEFGAFYDFLAAMGFSQNDIDVNAFSVYSDDNARYGLAPPRPMSLASSADNYGLFIPMVRKTCPFGPWMASGTRFGPITLSSQSDLNPARFNSYANLDTAANETVAKSFAPLDVVDFASLSLAGLPQYNLGDQLGDNAYIIGMSMQFGIDGIITNYELRTFAIGNVNNSKLLNDRYYKVLNASKYNNNRIDSVESEIAKLKRDKELRTNQKVKSQRDIIDANNNSKGTSNGGNYIVKYFG